MRPLGALFRRRRQRRPDPSPSRLAWRIERWWLTPGVRFFLRTGVPFALSFAACVWYLSDTGRRTQITDAWAAAVAAVAERPEFMVRVMAVDGAGDEVAAEIRDILPIELPASSFDIDLEAIRKTVAGLDPVESASVRIRPGGVLELRVTERVPVAVWRSYDRVSLIDATGAHVAEIPTRLARPDLPLIAGAGARPVVGEALALIAAAEPLGARLRGLVRMGERRWDVILDRGQRILLPETGAVMALERVIALDAAQELLARDLTRVDMRLPQRATVQMTGAATAEWWRIRAGSKD
jgi:cell division protein FtsQ